ncbi:MAG: GNAT family N-acetyltransferase [Candidatus Parvarchaeota archaeon]|nr:GNAT family N-acetyltransferase [Candidatus Jingweiarchaeum tengchongense]MCW1298447.1 GNAT family N-acetyltransferase [Candidatus Jingweiarchaeum tengchongense]MCW1300539.1 GNAT family N-acetyltransferase [Candidatus Jingweiarchaeum tengchongense]MCW1304986.1 GNAT family N-acetyltransferase [Candidatus Jingweiarchaeum tengchongense]MCW1310857.1 GNAT family N-acetyltransferase [Candidatus Jingweiarchaeum tengchongense]
MDWFTIVLEAVEIKEINKEDKRKIRELARCYIEIWRDEPWNEDRKCPTCDEGKNNFGRNFRNTFCPVDGTRLVPYWTIRRVLKDLSKELNKKDATCLIAETTGKRIYRYFDNRALCTKKSGIKKVDKDTIIGFTWGYGIDKEEIFRLTKSVELLDLLENERVAYIDEIGVLNDFRALGIGEELCNSLIWKFNKKRYNSILTRTNPRAEAAISLFKKLGFKDTSIKDPVYNERIYLLKRLE